MHESLRLMQSLYCRCVQVAESFEELNLAHKKEVHCTIITAEVRTAGSMNLHVECIIDEYVGCNMRSPQRSASLGWEGGWALLLLGGSGMGRRDGNNVVRRAARLAGPSVAECDAGFSM